jgi:hypothetical protein
MEDVLDTYALPPDPKRPLVNLDEFSKQLLSEIVPPRAARAATGDMCGAPRRHDAEYVRERLHDRRPAHGDKRGLRGQEWETHRTRLRRSD